MKVLFIFDTDILKQEPLGAMHIAALLKQHGHTCESMNLAAEKDLVAAVRERDPQLLAFSATTGYHRRLVRASQEIKKSLDILSIFGGPHPSYSPEMIEQDGVDIVCRGEGEYPMLELVEALEAGKDFANISNLWVKRNGRIHRNPLRSFVHDLDSLPWPDREISTPFPQLCALPALYIEDVRCFMGGRGCPYDCSYCFNHLAKRLAPGRYVRWRSVENLLAELEAVKAQYGMRFVEFQDDTFVLNVDWLEEFCAHYRQRIGIPFLCNVRADLVTDRVSRTLADAGCMRVFVGLEAGNDHIRRVVLNRDISREQLIAASRSLQAHGIRVSTLNMFGLPFETIDTVLETIELNLACRPQQTCLYFYVPYPGTRLAQIAMAEGFFHAEDLDSLPELVVPECSSVNLNLEQGRQIEQLARLTHFCIHFPIFYPLIRFLFKRQHGDWIKTVVSQGLSFLEGIYVRATRQFRRFFERR